ncbi:DUF2813 domain-containing protein [Orbaceae bacterium ESL0727]|nr:DUF2813 domain-containing protein [Orbaceae bacterium ESL0727]
MFIEHIDIVGFKGINQLSLTLNADFCTLIGENRWGRSSLINALMLFSLDEQAYQFVESDFYHDDDQKGGKQITINATYCESTPNELDNDVYQPLLAVMYRSQQDGKRRITYQISAEKSDHFIKNGQVITRRFFVDEHGQPISSALHRDELNDQHDAEKSMIAALIGLNPVMRLRKTVNTENLPITNQPLSDYYITQLSAQLRTQSIQVSKEELHRGLQAASSLLEYYFADQTQRYHYKQIAKKSSPKIEDWDSLDHINNVLEHLDDRYLRSALLGIFSAIVEAKGTYKLSPHAVPILVLEEPESLLHPIILSVGFRLLKNFPTQKIITSNSSDLISLFPLESIYHLIRLPGQIVAKHVEANSLSVGDSRRILFHILYRHASAIFARCWLLVEGETEVWLLRELAELCGYHLSSEGIQLIEFAQCGLKPLIKYADQMGIHWYVMTDGDIAGKKYADTVQALSAKSQERHDYLTVLPARDIENFLFKHGFNHVYKLTAYNTTDYIDMPAHRIIQKAIHRSSKPDLAIAICDDAKSRGMSAVPQLLKEMFAHVIKTARSLL